jgi:hypothetical protein
LPVILPAGVRFSYSLVAGDTVEVANTGHTSVNHGVPTSTEPTGAVAAGEVVTLETPGWLESDQGSEVTLTYTSNAEMPDPGPDPGPPPESEQPTDATEAQPEPG